MLKFLTNLLSYLWAFLSCVLFVRLCGWIIFAVLFFLNNYFCCLPVFGSVSPSKIFFLRVPKKCTLVGTCIFSDFLRHRFNDRTRRLKSANDLFSTSRISLNIFAFGFSAKTSVFRVHNSCISVLHSTIALLFQHLLFCYVWRLRVISIFSFVSPSFSISILRLENMPSCSFDFNFLLVSLFNSWYRNRRKCLVWVWSWN